MPGFSDSFENKLLALLFNGTAIPGIADNASSGALANLYLGLHTADPGDSGNQTTNETNYTGYARKSVARSTAGWTAPASGITSLAANQDFPQGTGGSGTITHFSVGVASSGATDIIMSGPVSPNIPVGASIIPRLTTATTCSLD